MECATTRSTITEAAFSLWCLLLEVEPGGHAALPCLAAAPPRCVRYGDGSGGWEIVWSACGLR